MLSTLARTGEESSLSLRYLSLPNPAGALRHVEAQLLGATRASTAADAEGRARQLNQDLKRVIQVTLRDAYAFAHEPAAGEDLTTGTAPFAPRCIAELRRHFSPETGAAHLRGNSTFARILETLLVCGGQTMISVQLRPVSVAGPELEFLERAALPDRNLIQPAEEALRLLSASTWQTSARVSSAYALARLARPDIVTPPLMLMRVFVASDEPLSPMVLHTIGDELWGDATYEVDMLDAESGLFPEARDSIRYAWTSVPPSRFELPPELERVPYLADAYEASRAFRLPLDGYTGAIRSGFSVIEAPAAVLPKTGVALGHGHHPAAKEPLLVRLSEEERTKHVYVVGKTGTGKSTLLARMIEQDINAGAGVCVIDPHGDLVDSLLPRIPERRADEVVLLDPAMTEFPFGLNLLELDRSRGEPFLSHQKDFVVQEMIGIMRKLFYHEHTGPVFEHNLRNMVLTMLDDSLQGQGTLVEVPQLLTNRHFRDGVRARMKDELARDFWTQYDELRGGRSAQIDEQLWYVVSKFDTFVMDRLMRRIIGQAHSTVSVAGALGSGQILLVKLQSSLIGELNASLLGMIVIGKLRFAAMARAVEPPESRAPYFVYVDEFHNFASSGFETLLAEGRKYGLGITVANQHIGQLSAFNRTTGATEDRVAPALFGNVGTIVSFRIGAYDAHMIATEMGPPVDANDLASLKNYHALVKTIIDGSVYPPFTVATTAPSTEGSDQIAEYVRAAARTKHGTPSEDVDRELSERACQIRERGERAAQRRQSEAHGALLGQQRGAIRSVLDGPTGPPQAGGSPFRTLERMMDTLELSRGELAELFGISRQAIDGWFRRGVPDGRRPKLVTVARVLDLLEHQLKPDRIGPAAKTPAKAYGGLTMLQMIRAERHEELLQLVRDSFDWGRMG